MSTLIVKQVSADQWSKVPFFGPLVMLIDEHLRLGAWNGSQYVAIATANLATGSATTGFPAGTQLQDPTTGRIWGQADGAGGVLGVPSSPYFSVDLRDWSGLDLKGNNDCSSILQAAIDQAAYSSRSYLGFSASLRLLIPHGRVAFGTQLLLRQNSWIEGVFGADGGTELRWVGADGVDAITNIGGLELSFMHLSNLRLKDFRSSPTSGRGIALLDYNNGVSLKRLQVLQFPVEQIYVGAASGQASDCVEIDDVWVSSTAATAAGLLIERIDNQCIVRNLKSDITTTPANDGYVIRLVNIANDNAAISIDAVKHESNNRCPTISLPQSTRGNVSIRGIVQRNPTGGAAGAGDVIQIGALAGGSSYAADGTAKGWTTGSGSEGGGRLILENISGANHGDWTGASGAATIRCLGTTTAVYGPVQQAQLGASGRIVRNVAGNGIPAGSVYGNAGDTYSRLDATSSDCSNWIKRGGNGATTGWQPLAGQAQSVSYAATLGAVNFNSGNRVQVGSLTGNITSMSSPTNVPPAGTEIVYEFTQDGTGGRTITWSSLHKGAWPTSSGTAGQKQTVVGRSDGTNLLFIGSSGWY